MTQFIQLGQLEGIFLESSKAHSLTHLVVDTGSQLGFDRICWHKTSELPGFSYNMAPGSRGRYRVSLTTLFIHHNQVIVVSPIQGKGIGLHIFMGVMSKTMQLHFKIPRVVQSKLCVCMHMCVCVCVYIYIYIYIYI